MDFSHIKALSFDCYGTLIHWEKGILKALEPLLAKVEGNHDEAQILGDFGAAEHRLEKANPQMAYPRILTEVYGQLAHQWGVVSSREEANRFGTSVGQWPAFPDSAAALQYLKRHFKLIILSNVDRQSFAASAKRLGVVFDWVFTAEEIGSYKPDPQNFHYMLDALSRQGIEKRQLLHVAQSQFHDIEPAKSLDLKNVWVHRRHEKKGWGATLPPANAQTPDWVVDSMAELTKQHHQWLSQ